MDQNPQAEEKVKGLVNKAMELLYSSEQSYQQMKTMFQKAGNEGFPKVMSTVVNGVLDRVEQQIGQLPDNELAGLAAGVMMLLSKDLIEAEVINVDNEVLMATAQKVVSDWEQGHSDRVQPSQDLPQQPQAAPQQPQGEPPTRGFMK